MKCHICGHETQSFLDERTDILYYHCSKCESIFKSPEYFQDLSEQKERYDLHENDEHDVGYRAYFQRFLDFILPLMQRPKNALDFGCGATSLLAKMIHEEGIACEYYDPIYHPDTLDETKKYDLIVSTEVFEHLERPREVLGSLLDRLEEGGYLALQTQFHPNDVESFKTWYYHQDPTHIVFFTAQTFRVLCEVFACEFVSDNGVNMVLLRKSTAAE